MQEFFSEDKDFHVSIPNGEIIFHRNFLSKEEASFFNQKIHTDTPWRKDKITVFGKTYDQPRLTSLHSVNSKPYSYSNLTLHPNPMTSELMDLLKKIQQVDFHDYNAVLLNLYRDGKDSNGWHADDEIELGKNPIIASISLGEERYFHLKHRYLKEEKFKIKLSHGSLLIMKGEMQHYWLHQIPKTAKKINQRINLTFRKII